MSKLNAWHRFAITILFIVFGFGFSTFLVIHGIQDNAIGEVVLGTFFDGVIAGTLKDIGQFYFRTSSKAEKKIEELKESKNGN
jgi:hypothetical protein